VNDLARTPLHEISVALAAVVGATLSMIGTGLYLRDIRQGRTTPHRGSWLVWGVISVLAAVSHGAQGGRWSLLVLSAQAAATLVVLALAVRCGVGWMTVENLLVLSLATLGVLGWLLLAAPIAATASAAVADGAGLLAILPKVWTRPDSETLATYALAGATGLLGALAVEAWDVGLLLFPVYFCLGNTATAVLIALRRRMVPAVERPAPTRLDPFMAATVVTQRTYGRELAGPRHGSSLPHY
jgi:hypothetical protein